MIKYACATAMALWAVAPVPAQQLQIAAPDDWRTEAIKLPPEFAADMGWRGDAVVRFSPGMFNRDSEQFFSYVFMMRVSGKRALNEDGIRKELLSYYRGLSVDVAKLRGIEVDTDSFTLQLKPQPTDRAREQRFLGKLTWLEPFATGAKQDLYLEIDHWRDEANQQNFLFVCASPSQAVPNKVWSQLRGIRAATRKTR